MLLDNKEELKSVEFFNNLEEKHQNMLINQAQILSMKKSNIILQEGSTCGGFVFVLSGSIRVYKLSEEGREITLYRITRNNTCILTISCLLSDTDYNAIAQVEEDVRFLLIPTNLFKILFSESEYIQKYVFTALSNRLSEVMMIVEEITFSKMDKRIAKFLVDRLSTKTDKTLIITHEEIALDIGTAREVVSRILKDFEKKEYIKLNRGSISLVDDKQLKKLY